MSDLARRTSAKSREMHCPLCDRLCCATDEGLIPPHQVGGRRRDRPICAATGWHVEPHEWLWP